MEMDICMFGKRVFIWLKEGVILYDFPLPYATFKYTSNQILQDDEEGLRLYNMLNDDVYNRPDYNKGGK